MENLYIFQAARNENDLDSVAKPPHRKPDMGTFQKYYSGELKAPILTIVIGGNHEASNYLQELAFGGWLCPNIYYLGNCGVVDVVNDVGKVILTVGGLSGVYSPKSFSQKRFEFPPYNDSSIRSVYHIRHIDKTMLNSMPSGSDDISISRKIRAKQQRYKSIEKHQQETIKSSTSKKENVINKQLTEFLQTNIAQ